jgi:hemoglobin
MRWATWMLFAICAATSGLGTGCRTREHQISDSAGTMEPMDPLYNRLGGEQGVQNIVNDLTDRVMLDPRVNFMRAGTPAGQELSSQDVDRFRAGMTAFLTEISGGARHYSGSDMRTAHRGMRITEAEFQAFKENLRAALANQHVTWPSSEDLLNLVEDYRAQIVEPATVSGSGATWM